jgi:hypothetical protein
MGQLASFGPTFNAFLAPAPKPPAPPPFAPSYAVQFGVMEKGTISPGR